MQMMVDPTLQGTNQPLMQPPQPGPQMPGREMPPVEEQQGEEVDYELDKALQGLNIAEQLRKRDKKKGTNFLAELGNKVCVEYDADEVSREEWMKRNEKWMKLATQVVEKKTFPWDGAANIKYPLLTQAALQFSARSYSSLVPSFDIVKCKVIGPDKDGKLTDLANTLSTHMSFQILYEMDDWEENMDTLCFVTPITGVMFKKTYYDTIKGKNCSELVHAKDFVVSYYTKSLKKSSRYTHILRLSPNDILEFQRFDMFLEYDEPFGAGQPENTSSSENKTTGVEPNSQDEETPRKILEQYRRIDLDDDGYKEPYIVTVDYETRKVLRVSPNFLSSGVDRDEDGKIRCITPCNWFTKFGFLPNPDGGFYDLGFGLMLGGLNEAINSLSNQLLDSGTLQCLQAGFIAKGLRPDKSDMKFKVGEWKQVNNTGDDLRKNIVPLPVNPPSPVLFELLGAFATAGKETASIADIFTGKMPGQNTPAATTMATIEQGLKVFTSIYKRLYRSMQQEFEKLFELNKIYMPNEVVKFTAEVNGENKEYKVSKFDYQGNKVHIKPAADPNMVSETQKLLKIQGLQEAVQYGHVNPQEMTRQMLVFGGQENIQALMTMPPPQDPLEVVLAKMEYADKDKDRQLEMMKLQSEARKRESEIVLNLAKAKQLGDEQGAMLLEHQLEQEKASAEIQTKWMDLLFKREEHKMDMQQAREKHEVDMYATTAKAQQDVAINEQLGATKVAVAKEQGKQKIQQGDEMGKQRLKQAEAQAKQKEKLKPKAEA